MESPRAPDLGAKDEGGAELTTNVFRDTLKDGSKGPAMVLIPAGSFKMGSPLDEEDRSDDEGPLHTVEISKAFAMGKYEVTFEEYNAFVKATGRSKPTAAWDWFGHYLVTADANVSWKDVTAYVDWLSKQAGKRYRLPTEAEWEYAAWAGTETAFWWGNEVGENRANCTGCGSRRHRVDAMGVGSFEPNPFGLYDVVGNAWEWVEDCGMPVMKEHQPMVQRGSQITVTIVWLAAAPGTTRRYTRARLSGFG